MTTHSSAKTYAPAGSPPPAFWNASGHGPAMPAPVSNRAAGETKAMPERQGRYTEKQILEILNETAPGVSIARICRQHGISTTTFFRWRNKFGSRIPSAGKDEARLQQLEEENRQLKALLAEAVLENASIREKLGLEGVFRRR